MPQPTRARRPFLALLAALPLGVAAAPAAAQEIPVGVPMALTGPYAFVGVPIRNGILLGLEESAPDLLPLKVRVIPDDTASDKAQTVSVVTRLAQREGAALIIGPTSSIEGTAAAPVANELRVPLFTSAVSADVVRAGPWSFKVTASPADIMQELARYAAETLKVRKVALVFNRDNDGFVAQKNTFRDGLRAAGAQIIAEEGILGSDADFTALSTKLAGLEPDALFVASPAEQGANIVIQARQAGLAPEVRVLAPPSMASDAYLRTGGRAVEGSVIVADYFPGGDSPMNRAFVEAYRRRYGDTPDNWAAVGYTLGRLSARALKEAGGGDRERIREALGHLDGAPVVLGGGTFHLGPDRAPTYGASIVEIRGGKAVAVR